MASRGNPGVMGGGGTLDRGDEDHGWVVELPGSPTWERVAEALGALANGAAGVRGSREEDGAGTATLFVCSGVYTGDDVPRLLEGPAWTSLRVLDGGRAGRRLDLRTGVLVRDDGLTGFRSLRFVSASRPDAAALRAEGPADRFDRGELPGASVADDCGGTVTAGVERWTATTASTGGGAIVVAARDRDEVCGADRVVERLVAWSAASDRVPSTDDALGALAAIETVGFDGLLAEHRAAWARRWADAWIAIDGAPDDQLAARFAVFHLLNAASDRDEAAVGARGLTGQAYGGHVFWDADVYVLPALAAIRPAAARAMLEYRIRRLPAARAAARALGLDGARFPWESAGDGTDVTPPHVRGRTGELIPIRTGAHEEHIVADVAWAAHEYARWTGDRQFLRGAGRPLIVETARYWAGRVRIDDKGRGHLYGVIGPDEYHGIVDDNAYTNLLARWNLRNGARLVDEDGDTSIAAAWRDLADRIVDGWDPRHGRHEQFAGYRDLEPLVAEHVAPRPFAADLVLGADRVAGSQLVKQPDVLLLHHLIPDDLRGGSLPRDLDFYEPRTSHGSSLSPAIHAALFARAGQPDRALDVFRIALRLDLDDLTGTTASGVHLATMGGVWQALAYGFLGLRARAHHLDVDPHLPDAWTALHLGFRFHGTRILVHADHTTVRVDCDEPVTVRLRGSDPVRCEPPGRTWRSS